MQAIIATPNNTTDVECTRDLEKKRKNYTSTYKNVRKLNTKKVLSATEACCFTISTLRVPIRHGPPPPLST